VGQQQQPEFDTSVPQTARIWNYWLGGKDNFPVDRAVGDQVLELVDPGVVSPPRWRPEPSPSGLPAEIDSFCGVGRKP